MEDNDTAQQPTVQMPASTEPSEESNSSVAVSAEASLPSSSVRIKETVSQILNDFPETVKVRLSHTSLQDECIVDINRALLIHLSLHYREVFLGYSSDQDKENLIMEISPEDMEVFKRWLYEGDGELKLDVESQDDGFRQLVRLYIFATHYNFLSLRRAIMTVLFMHGREHHIPRALHASLLYDSLSQLPPTSPLCRWLLEYCYHENTT
ncbi:hypothetical protein KCU67_g1216, partial [Aureobasidium melanogenum]